MSSVKNLASAIDIITYGIPGLPGSGTPLIYVRTDIAQTIAGVKTFTENTIFGSTIAVTGVTTLVGQLNAGVGVFATSLSSPIASFAELNASAITTLKDLSFLAGSSVDFSNASVVGLPLKVVSSDILYSLNTTTDAAQVKTAVLGSPNVSSTITVNNQKSHYIISSDDNASKITLDFGSHIAGSAGYKVYLFRPSGSDVQYGYILERLNSTITLNGQANLTIPANAYVELIYASGTSTTRRILVRIYDSVTGAVLNGVTSSPITGATFQSSFDATSIETANFDGIVANNVATESLQSVDSTFTGSVNFTGSTVIGLSALIQSFLDQVPSAAEDSVNISDLVTPLSLTARKRSTAVQASVAGALASLDASIIGASATGHLAMYSSPNSTGSNNWSLVPANFANATINGASSLAIEANSFVLTHLAGNTGKSHLVALLLDKDGKIYNQVKNQDATIFGSNRITDQTLSGVTDLQVPTALAVKGYVNLFISGFVIKQSVNAASVGNIAIATPGATIDGVTMTNPMRVLLKDQTVGTENGVYTWTGAAIAMTRTTDFDTGAEAPKSAFLVNAGTVNAGSGWICTNLGTVTFGTDIIAFSKYANSSQSYSGGAGITQIGYSFSLTPLTFNKAMITNGSGIATASAVSATELGYLAGVTSAIQTQFTGKQAASANLTALAAIASNGFITRTGAGTYTNRVLTSGTGVTVTNGDGVAGNPTFALNLTDAVDKTTAQTLAQKTLTTPIIDSIKGALGLTTLKITDIASAVSYVEVKSSITAVAPEIKVISSDTNANLKISAKGTGEVEAIGFIEYLTFLIPNPQVQDYIFDIAAKAYIIESVKYTAAIATGTPAAKLKINTTEVTGSASGTITTAVSTLACTAANTLAVDNILKVSVTSIGTTFEDLLVKVKLRRT